MFPTNLIVTELRHNKIPKIDQSPRFARSVFVSYIVTSFASIHHLYRPTPTKKVHKGRGYNHVPARATIFAKVRDNERTAWRWLIWNNRLVSTQQGLLVVLRRVQTTRGGCRIPATSHNYQQYTHTMITLTCPNFSISWTNHRL